MDRYFASSQYHKNALVWLWPAIAVLAVWLAKEVQSYLLGRPSFIGMAYGACLSGMLIWRYGVQYTYRLTDSHLFITSRFLRLERTYKVALDQVETYSEKYVKSVFRQAGIKRFLYRYSSGDGNATRIVIFCKQGVRQAVLLRTNQQFIRELQRLLPDKCVQLESNP